MSEQFAGAVKPDPQPGASGGEDGKSAAKGCALGCGGFLLLAVLVIAFTWMTSGDDEPEAFVPTQTDARFVCEEWVKERLKAPATAEFTDGAITGDLDGYTITGTVDSENGFGALIRSDWSCEIRYEPSSEEWRGSASVS